VCDACEMCVDACVDACAMRVYWGALIVAAATHWGELGKCDGVMKCFCEEDWEREWKIRDGR